MSCAAFMAQDLVFKTVAPMSPLATALRMVAAIVFFKKVNNLASWYESPLLGVSLISFDANLFVNLPSDRMARFSLRRDPSLPAAESPAWLRGRSAARCCSGRSPTGGDSE